MVLTFEWETWFPLMARLPVKSQTLDMDSVLKENYDLVWGQKGENVSSLIQNPVKVGAKFENHCTS